MRLIDAEEESKWASEHILDAKERYGILDFLRDCSTVDAVPVVHCRDCEYSAYNNENEMYCYHCFGLEYIGPDHFCSYGERK